MNRLLVVASLLGACGSKGEPPTGKPAVDPARWACKADVDCMSSCSLGAVNAAWYANAKVNECEDGCNNQLTEPPRCIDGGCVAFSSDPRDETKITRNDHCTRKLK